MSFVVITNVGRALVVLFVACSVLLLSVPAGADEPVGGPKSPARTLAAKAAAAKAKRKAASVSVSSRGTAKSATRQPTPQTTTPALSTSTASSQAQVDPRIERLQDGARKAWEMISPGKPEPPDTAAQSLSPDPSLDALKRSFRRPPEADTPPARTALSMLGARLFRDVKLSSDHRLSCASCHDASKSFTDGRVRGRNNAGGGQSRNTPSLWNIGFGKSFGWAGQSETLADFTRVQIERDGEMDSTLEAVTHWLSRDQSYAASFDDAANARPSLKATTITDALVAYQQTLLSPPTRFDRWVEGEAGALTVPEQAGFRLFAGKARCASCHSGWRFTDDELHDIGLRSTGGQQFKTPSLREAVWSAPYMHDGRMRSLEDVIAHYAGKLDRRASLAPELKQPIVLTASERVKLLAFIKTLSSDSMPRVR